MKILQILEAWRIAYNPTEEQNKLAELRAKVCEECPAKKVITDKLDIGVVCGECGCPISKKVYTNEFNPCPLHKWADIDEPYFIKQKKAKTLF